MKTIGGLRKLRHRGGEFVDWAVTFTAAAYNRSGCAHGWRGPPERGVTSKGSPRSATE